MFLPCLLAGCVAAWCRSFRFAGQRTVPREYSDCQRVSGNAVVSSAGAAEPGTDAGGPRGELLSGKQATAALIGVSLEVHVLSGSSFLVNIPGVLG